MREILFRGKRLDNGKWVVGNFVHKENEDGTWADNHIVSQSYDNREYKVDPATVGQYTGLSDKDGTKIFEGDVVKWNQRRYEVVYEDGMFCIRLNEEETYMLSVAVYEGEPCRILGNIHDTKLEDLVTTI